MNMELDSKRDVRIWSASLSPNAFYRFCLHFLLFQLFLSLPHLLLLFQDQNVLFIMKRIRSKYLKCKQYRKVKRRNQSSAISPLWDATVLPDILYLRTHVVCPGSSILRTLLYNVPFLLYKTWFQVHTWYAFDEEKLNLTQPNFFAVCANFLKERLSKGMNFESTKLENISNFPKKWERA